MLKTGILNLRHTNTLVIADRGFPSGQGSRRWTYPS